MAIQDGDYALKELPANLGYPANGQGVRMQHSRLLHSTQALGQAAAVPASRVRPAAHVPLHGSASTRKGAA